MPTDTKNMVKATTTLSLLAMLSCTQDAAAFFAPPGVPGVRWGQGTRLDFGLPSGFGGGSKSDEPATEETNKPEKKISAGGLVQLITAGMGAPFLGDYQGVDEDGKMMFSLEANNLVDEQGRSKQTQMPYFENGMWRAFLTKDAHKSFLLNYSNGNISYPRSSNNTIVMQGRSNVGKKS